MRPIEESHRKAVRDRPVPGKLLTPRQQDTATAAREDLTRKGGKRWIKQDVHKWVKRFHRYGWTNLMIAEGLGVSRRMVQYYVAEMIKPQEMAEGKVAPQKTDRDMLEPTIEAFEAWFLKFSPYDYLPEHARSWIVAFLTHRNLMLNVPPGHAKSEFFMIWIPIWLICRDRNVQILMVSNSAEDAATWALEVAGQLQNNEALIKAYGAFAPHSVRNDARWTPARGTFSVRGRAKSERGAQYTVESRGMSGRVLGRRADYILVDDPTKQEDAASETSRQVQLDHLRQQVFSRAEPGSTIMVIGQRVHVLDLYGELERQERVMGKHSGTRYWHVEKYPAVLRWPMGTDYRDPADTPDEPEAKVLWPQRWPYGELMEAYESIGGETAFFTMYQQEPAPESMQMFKESWLINCRDHTRASGVGVEQSGFFTKVRVVSVDPSPSKFNAIVVGDLLYNPHQFMFAVTEVHKFQAGLTELKAMVDEIIDTRRPDYFVFEESGFLLWLREDPWFAELKGRVKLLLHRTGINKNSKEFGVQSLAGDFEAQRITFPYGDETGRQMTALLHNEAVLYPSSATYDTLMALWFIKFHYKALKPPRATEDKRRGGQGWSFLRQLRGKDQPFEGYQREHAKLKRKTEEMIGG